MSRPDPSWRHIERRKTMCLNAIDTFNVDADHSGQINHMLPSGLSSACGWDSKYTRCVGSAKSGAKLLASTHKGWAEHAHTVSTCMQTATLLPIFYYFEDNQPVQVVDGDAPQQQPIVGEIAEHHPKSDQLVPLAHLFWVQLFSVDILRVHVSPDVFVL